MFRFLLGALVGSLATASYMRGKSGPSSTRTGRVDELSPAARNIVADPALNSGDGTPDREAGVHAGIPDDRSRVPG